MSQGRWRFTDGWWSCAAEVAGASASAVLSMSQPSRGASPLAGGDDAAPRQIGLAAFLDGESDRARAVLGDFAGLRVSRFYAGRRQRKELGFEVLGQSFEMQREFIRLAAVPFHRERDGRRLGQLRPPFGEEIRVGRLRGAGVQWQRQFRVAGNTRLRIAHLPLHPGLDDDRFGRQLRGRCDLDEEERLFEVDVIEEIAGSVVGHGNGPLERSGLEAGRQLPLDARGQPDVAHELPVNIPFRIDLEMDAGGERLARPRWPWCRRPSVRVAALIFCVLIGPAAARAVAKSRGLAKPAKIE